MRDLFFYPLAAAVAASFVYLALQPYAERLPSGPVSGGGRNAEDVTISGAELNRFIVGDLGGTQLDFVSEGDPPQTILRIDRDATALYDDPRRGPHVVLAEDLEFALESRPVEVIVEARSAGEFPASQFEVNYFAKSDSESGWKPFTLTPDFQPHKLSFFTPKQGRELGYDYIGIRPVTPDKHRTMEIRSVRILAAGKKDTPPAAAIVPMP